MKEPLVPHLPPEVSESLKEQRAVMLAPPEEMEAIASFQNVRKVEDLAHLKPLGEKLIKEGKVGCVLVAGGDGSRLGFNGPKGCFPITAVKHKTLFQYFAEKLLAASKRANRPLKMAIMTSPKNNEETQSFFKENDYFGVDAGQFSFFKQGELPLLDLEGNPFFEDKGVVAKGADGNGSMPKAFFDSGLLEKWQEEGIAYITFILVDNPLADPFDEVLIGSHAEKNSDVTIKCVEKEAPNESVGVLVSSKGHAKVIEYSELPRSLSGENLANISLFCFSLPFLKKIAQTNLPLHKALKASSRLNELGQLIPKNEPCAWKFERFIFDALPFGKNVEALLYPRESCFAPLKNAKGANSLETVQKALTLQDRKTLFDLTGKAPPIECIEIDPAFYYPTQALLTKWKDKPIPKSPFVAAD